MSTETTCYFCGKDAGPSRSLYSWPRCQIRYCSVACYKNSDHASCSEGFYRQWIESECLSDADQVFDRARSTAFDENRETSFLKKVGADVTHSKIFDFSATDASEMDEKDVNVQLQQLGITDPNDVEELLEALTEEEKEQFLKLVGDGALEKMDKEEISPEEHATDQNEIPVSHTAAPWWSRCSGFVVTESTLDDLPPDSIYSDILRRLDTASMLSRASPTIIYDILNALIAYCLVLRQSNVRGFWTMDDNVSVSDCSKKLLRISSVLSSTKTFDSVAIAAEEAFVNALSDEGTRGRAKSDVIAILKNFDWRKTKVASGRNQFVFLALCDLYLLFGKAKKVTEESEEKIIFRVYKKLEFYLKWADLNWECWRALAYEVELRLFQFTGDKK